MNGRDFTPGQRNVLLHFFGMGKPQPAPPHLNPSSVTTLVAGGYLRRDIGQGGYKLTEAGNAAALKLRGEAPLW